MLITESCGGNIHDACRYVNAMGPSRFFLQVDSDGRNSTIIFRAVCHADAVYICEKISRTPPTFEQWVREFQKP